MPKTQFVAQFVKHVYKTNMLVEKPNLERTRLVGSTRNIVDVAESVYERPSTPT